MADWIETFLDMTTDVRSPESFRLWTGITTITSVLERKTYMTTDSIDALYPNMYIFLVGVPAAGKGQSISICRQILANVDGIRLSPDNPTKRSFLNSLQEAQKLNMHGSFLPYSALAVITPELSVLISKYEKDFVADLTHIFDNPPKYTAPRQTSENVEIEYPTLNILAGTTPGALNDIMPDNAWEQGFTSRIMFIYGEPITTYRNVFKKRAKYDFSILEKDLSTWYNDLDGKFIWDDDAMDSWLTWFNIAKMAPVPTYGKLVNYAGRRDIFSLKLAMISAVSAGRGLHVTKADMDRAFKWLFDAEKIMPEVFRRMGSKSDSQLITDLHYHLYQKHEKTKKLITEEDIYGFLVSRVTHERIPGLIETAVKSGFLLKEGFAKDRYKPNTLDFVERNT